MTKKDIMDKKEKIGFSVSIEENRLNDLRVKCDEAGITYTREIGIFMYDIGIGSITFRK